MRVERRQEGGSGSVCWERAESAEASVTGLGNRVTASGVTPSASCPRFSVCTASRAVRPFAIALLFVRFCLFVDADDREQRRVVSEMSVRGVTQCLLAPNMPFGVDGKRWSNHSN